VGRSGRYRPHGARRRHLQGRARARWRARSQRVFPLSRPTPRARAV